MADNVFSVSSCRWVALGLILSITSVSLAEPGRSPGPIRWKAAEAGLLPPAPATTQPNAAEAGDAASLNSPAVVLAAKGNRHKVIQFDRIPTAGERTAMEAGGVKLLRYLGTNAFFASVQASPAAATAQAAGAVFAQEVQKEHKLHPMLIRREFPEYSKFKAPAVKGRLAVEPPSEKAHRLPAAVLNRKAVEPATSSDPHAAQSSAADVDTIALYVLFHPDIDLDTEAVDVIHKYGGVVRSVMRTINAAVIWIPQSSLNALAQDDAVQWLEPPLPPLRPASCWARAVMGTRTVEEPPYNLSGDGIVVLLYEVGGVDIGHPDFGGRVTQRDPCEPDWHSTAICGAIAGNGTLSRDPNVFMPAFWDFYQVPTPFIYGMAPGATVEAYVCDFDSGCPEGGLYTNPGDLEDDYTDGIDRGAVIANNSVCSCVSSYYLSCEWLGNYGLTSAMIDAIVKGAVGGPMRVVFPAGNERADAVEPWCPQPFRTIPPSASAKNSISVGAVDKTPGEDELARFSSIGPTDDGRLKPDLVAPGSHLAEAWPVFCGIWSTNLCPSPGRECYSNGATGGGENAGTSYSSAFVTGLCALILQDFKAQYPLRPLPYNSTLKALLVHNAQDKWNPGPDYATGYGSVRIQPAIDQLREGAFLEDSIQHGQDLCFQVVVAPNSNALKVTVAWDDVPGALNTASELVNDLDILAISPTGVIHYPWTLDPNAPWEPAVQTRADHINNIEQVLVQNPVPGMWTVRIVGYSVPEGPQPFSIAFTPAQQKRATQGQVTFDAPKYGCSGSAGITVIDYDLDVQPGSLDTITVTVTSPNEPNGVDAVLTETDVSSGRFRGTIDTASLHVGHDNTIVVTYNDANTGSGTSATVQDTAQIDCTPPIISDVGVRVANGQVMTVVFKTDEPGIGSVRYGLSCGSLTERAIGPYRGKDHQIQLLALEPNYTLQPSLTYYFEVEAVDDANNTSTDANEGTCYSFVSGVRDKYYADRVYQDPGPNCDPNHLASCSILFTPDGSSGFYSVCAEPNIVSLPCDPNFSIALAIGRYDPNQNCMPITLGLKRVLLYGQTYGSRARPIYIGANGYLTFTEGDDRVVYRFGDHFRLPRVSGPFNDLRTHQGEPTDPNNWTVRWKQTDDRLVVTWWNAPAIREGRSTNSQIEMFYDGRIRISWLGPVYDFPAVVGLSEGLGLPINFLETDFRDYLGGSCPFRTLTLRVQTPDLGSVLLDPNAPNGPPYVYTNGRQVNLTAQPLGSNLFDRWEFYAPDHPNDANYVMSDVNNPLLIVMSSDRDVTAVFLAGSGKCGRGVELGLPLALGVVVCGVVAHRIRGTRGRPLNTPRADIR